MTADAISMLEAEHQVDSVDRWSSMNMLAAFPPAFLFHLVDLQ